MRDDTIAFIVVVGFIVCLAVGLIVGNTIAKTGKGIGIMPGNGRSLYRYIEVPAELDFKSIDYEFSPSNGFITLIWERNTSK